MAIILLRHGATDRVSAKDPDPGLNAEGHAQVAAAVRQLPKVDAIVTDTKQRTQQTAHQWAQHAGVPVHVDPRLDNWNLGPAHAGQHSTATDALVTSLIHRPQTKAPGGGESAREYQDRLFHALGPLIASDRVIGVVNHSRGIRSVEAAMSHPDHQVTPESWAQHDLVPHAGAVAVTQTGATRL